MKSSLDQEQSTARAVQKLPVGVPLQPPNKAEVSSVDWTRGVVRLGADRGPATVTNEGQAWEWMQHNPSVEPVRADKLQGLSQEKPTAVGDALISRVERSITREVVTIRQLNADSMTVVLRPDPRSEIVLSLRQQNGHVEALVRCESATFQALHRDWSGLQESLAQVNVRLLPLEKSTGPLPLPVPAQENANGAGEFAQTSDRSPRQHDLPDPETEQPYHRESVTGPKPQSHPQSARASRDPATGWESWA